MAYDTKELERQSLDAITKYKLIWIEEVVSYLPCSRSTFYDLQLDKSDTIKEAISKNKIDLKVGLRKKMYDSDSATDRALLYRLLSTDKELEKISLQKTQTEISGEVTVNQITVKVKRPPDGT